MSDYSSDLDRLANLPPGYDEDDPYEGEDIDAYPQWWRENVQEFQAHNMRPYRPPQFRDGAIVPELVNELQEQLGVDIKFQNRNPQEKTSENPHQKHDWKVLVNGDPVSTIPRSRAPEGYSVYDIGADAFEELIRENCK